MKHAILGVLLVPLMAISVSAQKNWIMGDYDAMRTSWVQSETQFAPPLTLTTYDLPEPYYSIDKMNVYNMAYADEILYLGISGGAQAGSLAAFDYKAGKILWTVPVTEATAAFGNDPVLTDDMVIAGGYGKNRRLVGVNRISGAEIWSRDIPNIYGRSATLYRERLYVLIDSMYCLNPETGEAYWILPHENTQGGTPAFTGNYMVHVRRGNLDIRNANNGQVIHSKTGVSNEGLLLDERRAYVAGYDSVHAINLSDASVAWSHAVPEGVNIGFLSWNALARDDKTLIYAIWENSDTLGVVRALDLNTGAVKWSYTSTGEGVLSLTIVNGIVYFVEWGIKTLTGLDVETGMNKASITGPQFRTKVYYGDGKLFVGYENDPDPGGGVAVLTSPLVSVPDIPVPANKELAVYPNPIRESGNVSFVLESANNVSVRIVDALGRVVSRSELGRREAGTHTFRLGTAQLPVSLSSGVYRIVVDAGIAVFSTNLNLRR